MKCIKCSQETNNENELCEKCAEKENKKAIKIEFKKNKKLLKIGKFNKVEDETLEKLETKVATTTGTNACIVSVISSISGIITSMLIVPGFIFSFLGLVEGLVGLISSIRNKPKSYKNVISLVFSIVGFQLSLIALLLTITNFIILVVYLVTGNELGFVSLFLNFNS